jgi:hypothetical protein
MEQNTKNKEKSNAENVQAQPPVVAVQTSQISEENHPATAGCAAAPCSASGKRFFISDWLVNSALFGVEQNALEMIKQGKIVGGFSSSVTLRPGGGSIHFDLTQSQPTD